MRILIVIGTRPEVIKTIPLALRLKSIEGYKVAICSTGQHKEVMEQALKVFNVTPDYNLEVMTENQSLSELTAKILIGLQKLIVEFKPDLMISQGDTSTSFATCLSAFYEKVKIIHIEAGLRTGDIYSPFPEEMSRRVTAMISNKNFAPTIRAKENLLKEGIPKKNICFSGNTGIDALFFTREKINNDASLRSNISEKYSFLNEEKKLIIVTAHRRENHGSGIQNICDAILEIVSRKNVQVIFPIHHNPNSKFHIIKLLGKTPNVFLVDQIDYLSFVYLLEKSHLIITDSGGIQEEAPSLGKPLIVTRFSTERQDAIEMGSSILTGPVKQKIVDEALKLIEDKDYYSKMCLVNNPFGDGKAIDRIINEIKSMEPKKAEN
tara:strand:+ start:2007 stop:3143 length:1137 start_codon:yes stop_codon:yes gene_type:complete